MCVRVDFLNQPQFTVFSGGCGRRGLLLHAVPAPRGQRGEERKEREERGRGKEDCRVSTVKSECVCACTLSPRSRAQSPALPQCPPAISADVQPSLMDSFSLHWNPENFLAPRLKMDSCVNCSVWPQSDLAVSRLELPIGEFPPRPIKEDS